MKNIRIVRLAGCLADKTEDYCGFYTYTRNLLPIMILCLILLISGSGCNDVNYSRIVFAHGEAGTVRGDLYIMNWDGGTDWTRLTRSGLDEHPKWSPEKDQIVFHRLIERAAGENHFDIYKINPDGTGEELLIDSSGNDMNPAWSPDGDKIAFLTDRDGRNEIWIYDLRHRSEVRLNIFSAVTPALGYGATLTWSPEGDKIAFRGFASPEHGGNGIWVASYPSGRDQELLAEDGSHPNWSKRSNRIVYNEGSDIKVMNGDGTDKRTIAGAQGEFPVWSVNFDEIIFQRANTALYTGFELYRVQDDGRLLTRTTENDTNEMHPHF